MEQPVRAIVVEMPQDNDNNRQAHGRRHAKWPQTWIRRRRASNPRPNNNAERTGNRTSDITLGQRRFEIGDAFSRRHIVYRFNGAHQVQPNN